MTWNVGEDSMTQSRRRRSGFFAVQRKFEASRQVVVITDLTHTIFSDTRSRLFDARVEVEQSRHNCHGTRGDAEAWPLASSSIDSNRTPL